MFVNVVFFVWSVARIIVDRAEEVIIDVILIGFVESLCGLEGLCSVDTSVCVEASMVVFSMDVEMVSFNIAVKIKI